MALSEKIIRAYTDILIEELIPAMGCTEPIAIAYASSIASHALGNLPQVMRVGLSGNIIKNVKSVIVPATGGMQGIDSAICAGAVAMSPDKRLEVLCSLGSEDVEKIKRYKSEAKLEIYELETENVFEIHIEAEADGSTVELQLSKRHTNVDFVKLNGKDITSAYATEDDRVERDSTDRSLLNVKDIIDYAEQVDLDLIAPHIKRQIELNVAIANEGINGEWGAAIGKTLFPREGFNGDVRYLARSLASAGSDARMNGCELPVCIISGSGNQGITASVPVYAYWKKAGKYTEEELYRAVIVSDLITIHQKTGIGCLSAYCGAISAGCGCGCGICFLEGGRYYEIAHTLVNALAILSGTICDGAKSSCAAKIAMAVDAGILGYDMTKSGHQFLSGDGIITKGVENTIKNVSRLARDGMSETDKEIIKIMLGKD
ncbi:MAG: serine dehydratase subunit alpha family protein [Clostridia bacterium]|nr:serine dehydratase subunit alpha family protein [Clostridia bacterium]